MSEATPTFEAMNKAIRRAGFRVNNLCHRSDGMWQCNLRRSDHTDYFEFAYGVDAPHAMERALEKARSNKHVRGRPVQPDDMDPRLTGQATDPTAPIPTEELPAGAPAPAAASASGDEDLIG